MKVKVTVKPGWPQSERPRCKLCGKRFTVYTDSGLWIYCDPCLKAAPNHWVPHFARYGLRLRLKNAQLSLWYLEKEIARSSRRRRNR